MRKAKCGLCSLQAPSPVFIAMPYFRAKYLYYCLEKMKGAANVGAVNLNKGHSSVRT